MSSFALRTFLNLTPREDLRTHVDVAVPHIAAAVDWSLPQRRFVNALAGAIEALGDQQRLALEALFDQVEQLASEQGRRAMRSVVAIDPACVAEFDAMKDVRSCGLWLARSDLRAFERALAAYYADRRQNGKFWSAYHLIGDSEVALCSDKEAQAALLAGAREALGRAGGSVGRVSVEFGERLVQDPADGRPKVLIQTTIYSEGPPESALAFVADDEVERRTVRPVIAAAALYDPAGRVVEVVGPGGKEAHAVLAEAFVRSMLVGALETRKLPRRNVALHRFASRPSFTLRPEDRVSNVYVDRLTLAAPTDSGGLVILERGSREGDVYDAAAEWFSGRNPIGRAGWRVIFARLRVTFHPERDGARPKIVAVELTAPNRSNLRDQTEQHRLIAHSLMDRWGLYEPEE